MPLELRPYGVDTARDFEEVVRRAGEEASKCLCTAAYVPYWKDPSLARPCRERILAESRTDGYVAYADGAPVGWCQVAPLDSLPYYRERGREADAGPHVHAVTCLLVVPETRGRGLAHEILALVLDELRARGVRRVQAFPCRYGPDEDVSGGVELPESVCLRAGMTLLADHAMRPLYGMSIE